MHLDSIKKQQSIADHVLEALHQINPSTIVAGGAPRDWYMGNPCKDIDCFIGHGPSHTSVILKSLSRVLNVQWELLGNHDIRAEQDYARLPNMLAVYQGMIKDQLIQIVVMNGTNYGVIDNFPISSSHIWYKTDRGIVPTYEFEEVFIKQKTQVVMDSYWEETDQRYIAKMKERFPESEYKYYKRSQWESKQKFINLLRDQDEPSRFY